ncbi:MAG: helix-turn-helix transcriptional regulator [Steroidobacteraceae bacterium]
MDSVKLAALLDVSERQLRRLDDSGKLPAALELGGCKRWEIATIREWIHAGAPSRKEWAMS